MNRALSVVCALVLIATTVRAAHILELPSRELHAASGLVVFEGDRVEIRKGVFRFSPSLRHDGAALTEVGAEIIPLHAEERPVPVRSGFLGSKKGVARQGSGALSVRLMAIEAVEGNRSLGVVHFDTGQREVSPNRPRAAVRMPFSDISRVAVLYHVQISGSSSKGEPILLENNGHRTIRWSIGAYGFTMGEFVEPPPPPRPARITVLGAGPIAFPDNPYVGDTFVVQATLRNAGDLPTETMTARWYYGGESLDEIVPTIPGASVTRLQFIAQASKREDAIHLSVGGREWKVPVRPRVRPVLEITGVTTSQSYTDEPLEVTVGLRNRGSADAENVVIALHASPGETTVSVASVRMDHTERKRILWPVTTSDSFILTARVFHGGGELSTEIPVRRRVRPAPRFRLVNAYLDGARREGDRATVRAVVVNEGTAAGETDVIIRVHSIDAGTSVVESTQKLRLKPGEEKTVSSPGFAAPGGLVRGRIGFGTNLESDAVAFAQADIEPFQEVDHPGLFAVWPDRGGSDRLVRVDNLAYSFDDVARNLPIEPNVELYLPVVIWGPENGRAVPGLRVTLKGGDGFADRFDISSAESAAVYSIPSSALSGKFTVLLDALQNRAAFLIRPPRLLVRLLADQSADLEAVTPLDSGFVVSARNTARFSAMNRITIRVVEDGVETSSRTVIVPPGEKAEVFFPFSRNSPGRHRIRAELPFAATPHSHDFERLVVKPETRFDVSAPRPAVTAEEQSGMFGTVSNGPKPLHGLRIHALDEAGRRTGLVEISELPGQETAAYFFADAASVIVDYGPFTETLIAPPAAKRPSSLRLIDFGGDPPVGGRNAVIRIVRSAERLALPAEDLLIAVNGMLRRRITLPSLDPGHRNYLGVPLLVPKGETVSVLIYSDDGSAVEVATMTSPVDSDTGAPPGRAELGWIEPVIVSGRRAEFTTLYDRLGAATWKTLESISRHKSEEFALQPVITPKNVFALKELAPDTSALGRVRYREALAALLHEWKAAELHLTAGRLPVTVSLEHVAGFRSILTRLETVVSQPKPLDQTVVETILSDLAEQAEIMTGTVVDESALSASAAVE